MMQSREQDKVNENIEVSIEIELLQLITRRKISWKPNKKEVSGG